MNLILGDCLIEMAKLKDQSVDLILCDLPYGTTDCLWDTIIPFEPLWEQYRRIVKPNAAIVLTSSQPFSTDLINSNRKEFKYSIIWNKKFAANFSQVKFAPLKIHEDILIFCKNGKLSKYIPQMSKRDTIIKSGGNKNSEAISSKSGNNFEKKIYDEKFPMSIIDISNRGEGDRGFHPTQKPVALMEYLIKTYSDEGDVVMDNCMGSGTTGVACVNTNRKFIGIEQEEKYFEISKMRIEEAQNKSTTAESFVSLFE